MDKNENFLFYRSFSESIHLAPESDRLAIYEDLIAVCLGDIEIDDIPYPRNMLIRQCLASVESAKKRYEASIENGNKGGRPQKWVDREEAEKLYAELKTWDKVADALDVSRETLRKARVVWNAQKPKNPPFLDAKKPKNPNDNVNDNDNENDNYHYQLLNKAVEGSPKAPSPAEKGKPEKYRDENGMWRIKRE